MNIGEFMSITENVRHGRKRFIIYDRIPIFFELYAFIILTSTLVLGINYFVIIC